MAALTHFESSKRVVIKIGSALLVDNEANALRCAWLAGLAKDVARLRSAGIEVIIVSSGSIALGRALLGIDADEISLAESQAAAAVGQIALAEAYRRALEPHGLVAAQLLLTSEDGEDRRRYLNTQATLDTLLAHGAIPIVNENDTVATDEIRFGDNDRLAAQVAVMAGADTLILLSDVDGVYTDNPKTNPEAKHIPVIEEVTPALERAASGTGSAYSKGGMITKLLAAKTAMRGGARMAIAIGSVNQPISAIIDGARVTWFPSSLAPEHARKNWIAAMKVRGEVVIDAGAVAALKRGSSLLAAGCQSVAGKFARGDAVDILSPEGQVIARGLSAYDASEADKICGARSEEIEDRLGYPGRGALVHRDNMIFI